MPAHAPGAMESAAKTRIKYVNQIKPSEARAVSGKPKAASVSKPKPRDPPLERQEDPCDRATYEECKSAFNQLAALHAAAQAETAEVARRLDRTEQELRRAREQGAGYAAQIAAQEFELRRVKDGKRAVEELNSKLNTRLAGKAGEGSSGKAWAEERDRLKSAHKAASEERDRLKSAHKAASEERDRLKSAHRAASEERDRAVERARSYDDMLDHVDKAIGICARACDPHAPETARDMRETQETLRQFRKRQA